MRDSVPPGGLDHTGGPALKVSGSPARPTSSAAAAVIVVNGVAVAAMVST